MTEASDACDPLDHLVEEFLDRHRAGHRPSVTEFAARLPGREDEVRDLFPALVELEQLKPVTADGTVEFDPPSTAADHASRVGDYRILRLVGRGGMGAVYGAVEESLGRHVALKLLPAEAMVDPRRLERFRREARAAARLHHTNIVPVFGLGEADGRHFFAMQFIDGHPLDAIIDEVRRLKEKPSAGTSRAASGIAQSLMTGRFAAAAAGAATIAGEPGDPGREPAPPGDSNPALSGSLSDGGRHYWITVARIAAQAADALAYAHAQGILHRDIKPGNLLLDLRGTVWITDFGLAKSSDADDLTQQGDVIGTLRYLAPERFEGIGDHRADIYALGLTLYELLTLEPAFRSENRARLIEQVTAADPPGPRTINRAIPRDLETIVLKAIERDPSMRYQSAAELGEDLRRYVEDRPIWARRATVTEQFVRWCRRNRTVAALIATVMLAILAGAGAASLFAVRAERERGKAVARERDANLARKDAEGAAIEATRARNAASDSAEEARKRLVRLYVLTGNRYRDGGETPEALLAFHRAWELDHADPRADDAHRTRIAGAMDELPELLGACFHDATVSDAVFSPDGRRVLTRIEGDRAYIWDYERSRPVAPPLVHAGRVRHIAYSPDGKTVATASADGTAGIWDAETGTRRLTLKHDSPLTWVAFHPDGRRIATASEDRTVRMWSTADGRPVDWRLPVAAVVDHLAFSPDGSRILTAGRDGAARVWTVDPPEAVSPALPYRSPTDIERYQFNQDSWPRFAPDGRSVLSLDGEKYSLWPGGPSEAARTIHQSQRKPVEAHFIPRSGRVLLTSEFPYAVVVGLADGRIVHRLLHPRNANIGAVSPDGRLLLTCSSGGLVHLWDAASGTPARTPQRCGDFCSAVAFSPDGSRYLAASQDGTVRIWATTPRPPRSRPYRFDCGRANLLTMTDEHPSNRRSYTPDGQGWVEWTSGGSARYRPGKDDPPRPIPHPGPVDAARFCDDGTRLVVSGGGSIRAWDRVAGTPTGPAVAAATPISPSARSWSPIEPYYLSRDGTRIVRWDDARTLSVWDLTSGRQLFGPARHPEPGPLIFGGSDRAGWVGAATLSPDGRRLAVAIESSGTIDVWDVDAGSVLHHNRRFRGFVYELRFSDDGRRFLLYSSDNLARMYDTETGIPLGPALSQPAWMHAVAASPDGWRLAVYDRPAGALRVFEVERGERLVDIPCGPQVPTNLWFDAAGRSINVVIGKKPITLTLPRFDAPFADSADLIRFLTGRQIDENDGIAFVDQFTFKEDPGHFRDVFRAWKASRGGGE